MGCVLTGIWLTFFLLGLEIFTAGDKKLRLLLTTTYVVLISSYSLRPLTPRTGFSPGQG
jgi:hypothetical protein